MSDEMVTGWIYSWGVCFMDMKALIATFIVGKEPQFLRRKRSKGQ